MFWQRDIDYPASVRVATLPVQRPWRTRKPPIRGIAMPIGWSVRRSRHRLQDRYAACPGTEANPGGQSGGPQVEAWMRMKESYIQGAAH